MYTLSPQKTKKKQPAVFFLGLQKLRNFHQAEVVEFVDFLKSPGKYEKLGARVPKGALMPVNGYPLDTLKGSGFWEWRLGG